MTLWAYGDSFVAGDQDIPGRIDAIDEHTTYNRYNISFACHLAKKLNVELVNRGISGCSNFVQLDLLFSDADQIKPEDIVLFGFTSPWRDRWSIPTYGPDFLKSNKGPALVDRSLIKDNNRVGIVDFYYTLSALEKLESTYKFKVVAFNLFHNVLQDASEEDLKKFNFKNVIGLHQAGNTIMDVLSDQWGVNNVGNDDHTIWEPPKGLEHLFTAKRHPSLAGHKKIADWLYNYVRG